MLPACGDDSGTDASTDSATSVDSATEPDTGVDACELPIYGRACSTSADCVAVFHQIDCCGTFITMGLSRDEQAGFDTLEAACEATYPRCRCATGPTEADDGTTGSGEPNLSCVGGRCATSYGP